MNPSPNLTAPLTGDLDPVPASGSDGNGRGFELDRSGAAWRLRLLRDGREVGGGIFPDADYRVALEEGDNWITVPAEGWPA